MYLSYPYPDPSLSRNSDWIGLKNVMSGAHQIGHVVEPPMELTNGKYPLIENNTVLKEN